LLLIANSHVQVFEKIAIFISLVIDMFAQDQIASSKFFLTFIQYDSIFLTSFINDL
jgi:hypothetical protein